MKNSLNKQLLIGIIFFCGFMFISSLLVWPMQAILRQRRKQAALPTVIVQARWIAISMSFLNIVLLITFAVFMSQFIPNEFMWHVPKQEPVLFGRCITGICLASAFKPLATFCNL